MSTFPHRVALGVATLLLATSSPAFAQLTITFRKPDLANPADSAIPAACIASVDQKQYPINNDTGITWTLVAGTCTDFDASLVRLVFVTDGVADTHFWSHRHLRAGIFSDKTTISSRTAKKLPNRKTIHPYFITYNDQYAGDPELDINCDNCDTGPKK